MHTANRGAGDLLPHFGCARQKAAVCLGAQVHHGQRACGDDISAALATGHQGDFTEEVTGSQRRHLHRLPAAARDAHLGRSRLDQEQRVAHVALAHDHVASLMLPSLHKGAQDGRLRNGEIVEQPGRPQLLAGVEELTTHFHPHTTLRQVRIG